MRAPRHRMRAAATLNESAHAAGCGVKVARGPSETVPSVVERAVTNAPDRRGLKGFDAVMPPGRGLVRRPLAPSHSGGLAVGGLFTAARRGDIETIWPALRGANTTPGAVNPVLSVLAAALAGEAVGRLQPSLERLYHALALLPVLEPCLVVDSAEVLHIWPPGQHVPHVSLVKSCSFVCGVSGAPSEWGHARRGEWRATEEFDDTGFSVCPRCRAVASDFPETYPECLAPEPTLHLDEVAPNTESFLRERLRAWLARELAGGASAPTTTWEDFAWEALERRAVADAQRHGEQVLARLVPRAYRSARRRMTTTTDFLGVAERLPPSDWENLRLVLRPEVLQATGPSSWGRCASIAARFLAARVLHRCR